MDEKMMKAGGQAHREELITKFESALKFEVTLDMTADEKKRGKGGETGQGEYLTGAKRKGK